MKRAAVRAEIAAHNAEVERRKAEKRARRLTRRMTPNVRAKLETTAPAQD